MKGVQLLGSQNYLQGSKQGCLILIQINASLTRGKELAGSGSGMLLVSLDPWMNVGSYT